MTVRFGAAVVLDLRGFFADVVERAFLVTFFRAPLRVAFALVRFFGIVSS